jgi:ribosomal protein S18 acetylase RimI-like enzyme
MSSSAEIRERALARQRAAHAAVCDVIEPWAHGTIVRATRHPQYHDFNVVRVEQDPQMSVDRLAAVADVALAGLAHRRLDFEDAAVGEPLRAELAERGWRSMRLLWMRHEHPLPAQGRVAVKELAYDAVHELRVSMHDEDFPEVDCSGYFAQAREVAIGRGARVLAVLRQGRPVAFAQLEHVGSEAEITLVYVLAAYRGSGLGTALTSAAIADAANTADLWICADEEDRPKHLYERLGFRPVCVTLQFLRLPATESETGG